MKKFIDKISNALDLEVNSYFLRKDKYIYYKKEKEFLKILHTNYSKKYLESNLESYTLDFDTAPSLGTNVWSASTNVYDIGAIYNHFQDITEIVGLGDNPQLSCGALNIDFDFNAEYLGTQNSYCVGGVNSNYHIFKIV